MISEHGACPKKPCESGPIDGFGYGAREAQTRYVAEVTNSVLKTVIEESQPSDIDPASASGCQALARGAYSGRDVERPPEILAGPATDEAEDDLRSRRRLGAKQ